MLTDTVCSRTEYASKHYAVEKIATQKKRQTKSDRETEDRQDCSFSLFKTRPRIKEIDKMIERNGEEK